MRGTEDLPIAEVPSSQAAEGWRSGAAHQLRSPVFWTLLATLALEFFFFDHFGARRHTNIYPRWNDQIQYLSESYAGYEYAKAHGLPAGLWAALNNPSAQGTLHDFFALIAFTIAGPSRAAALALNMLALIAWQFALFIAVSRVASARWLALAAALLPLALAGPWQNIPGSAYDFRLDHLAMCALGITAAAAWLSDGFRSRRGAQLFGLAVGLTLLTRFLTGTYFVLIFAGLLGWLFFSADRKRCIANLARAAGIAFVIAAPAFWLNRDAVREYYWVGHYFGPESVIRNQHLGIGSSLAFVGDNLLQRHLGWFFIGLAVVVTSVLAVFRQETKRKVDADGVIMAAIFLLAPALVLTLHSQKSEVVVSALVPGVISLVAAGWILAARRAPEAILRWLPAGVAVLVFAFFVHTQVPPAASPAAIAEARRVNSLADEIFRRARSARLDPIRVGVDHITDALDAQVLRVLCYERHHVWLRFDMRLPTSIAQPGEELVMGRLAESDFVFVTAEGPEGRFPYDHKLTAMRPTVRAWCDGHLRIANDFTLFGRHLLLYQRRELPFP